MTQAKQFSMLIDGRGRSSDAWIEVRNPATEAVFALAPNAARADLDDAVDAARRAFPAWSGLPHAARQTALRAIGATIAEHAEMLADLLTAEQGRPIAEARPEILGAAFWCGAVADLELPVTVNEDSAERRSETRHVPLGVVGGIVPWNYPVLLAIWKIAPALLAGNTMVVKPSPFTPLTMLKLGELLRDSLPAGVLNIVSGDDRLGPWLSAHPGIDKISFTGSTAVGRKVMESAAAGLKRVMLELGGNDPAIVLPDVDVPAVAEELFWAAFRNCGQVCIAAKRLYVHEDVYDAVKDALVDYARGLKVGDGSDEAVQIGPVQNRLQYERVKALIAECRDAGHSFAVGGEVDDGTGYFIPVTIVDNPPETSRVVAEEAFGPILPMLRFRDIDDVVARANDSVYGLGASVWSSDSAQAAKVAARLQAGTVWINEVQHVMPLVVFSGHKQSGIGVENGLEGLLEYTNVQTITVRRRAAQPVS